MTKQKILTISEITDSVEMLQEKPNKGLPIFTWVLLLLLIATIIWCSLGSIDYFVKATGMVRPVENISTISTLVSGKVKSVNISEGDVVEKGDVLFTVDISELEQSCMSYEKEKERLETDNIKLDKLNQCVEEDKNLFNADSELPYYLKYEKYIGELNSISENYRNSSIDNNKSAETVGITAENITAQINSMKEDLNGLQQLQDSIKNAKNMFSDKTSIYALQYEDYVSKMDTLEKTYADKSEQLDKAKSVFKVGGISKSEYDSVSKEVESAESDIDKYTSETNLSVEKQISDINDEISNLTYNLKSQNHSYSAYSSINHDKQLALDNAKLEFLQSISDAKKSNEITIASLDKQISELKINIDNAKVCSPINGIVNMYTEINESDIVQSGQTVATIVPVSDDKYKLTMYLTSSDISEVEVGQTVKLRFSAYPYQEYGEVLGTIKNISSDARVNEQIGSYYVSEVAIDDANGLELVSGMECEARVVTKQRKIIYWLLEKLDFINDK